MSKELEASYKFTKAQLARLELLEKQNEIMLKALVTIEENSDDDCARACADEAVTKVRELES